MKGLLSVLCGLCLAAVLVGQEPVKPPDLLAPDTPTTPDPVPKLMTFE